MQATNVTRFSLMLLAALSLDGCANQSCRYHPYCIAVRVSEPLDIYRVKEVLTRLDRMKSVVLIDSVPTQRGGRLPVEPYIKLRERGGVTGQLHCIAAQTGNRRTLLICTSWDIIIGGKAIGWQGPFRNDAKAKTVCQDIYFALHKNFRALFHPRNVKAPAGLGEQIRVPE